MTVSWYYPNAVDTAATWWRYLHGLNESGTEQIRHPNRAAIAQLRRCRQPIDALILPEGMNLVCRVVVKKNFEPTKAGWGIAVTRVATLAVLLAHLRTTDEPLMRKLGEQTSEHSAILNKTRFLRALRADDPQELMAVLRRLLAQANWRACPIELASSVLYWGDKIRAHWAAQYYWHDAPSGNFATTATVDSSIRSPNRESPQSEHNGENL